ncbi:unnamed protein product [Clonostachys rosea f. rosea IK726]|uniref:EF-hand domain-containing protein n=2 Tax=Bionectria ochroleuca TaxID=29856 RepID=A0A0B7KFX6_BIOOC|nr:unnamed protein product [Clonostachys rosea f. rosea IK726]
MAGPRTKADIERILNKLDTADEGKLGSAELQQLLTQLHTSTRSLSEDTLQSLFSRRGVRILGQYAFQDTAKPEHLPALRCLNNVLVRSSQSRLFLSSEIGANKIASLFKRQDPEDDLALSNIVIFSCHGNSLDLTEVLEKDGFANDVNAMIARYAKSGPFPTAELTSPSAASLRLLASLASRYESQAHLFLDSVDHVLDMLARVTVGSPPLELPVSLFVNCLPVLPVQEKTKISVEAIDKLVEILKASVASYAAQEDGKEILPLLFGLRRIAQSEATEAKTHLKASIIPTDEDRHEALGKGQTLPHKILNLSSESVYPEVREVIMSLFFELSDKDPSLFVHNVGFGNAAGYLSSQGIEISQKDLGAGALNAHINPITGQRIDSEPNTILPEMTDEEKEREAERLFVLFERLRATGIVDVENPVVTAAREGRIEELPSSDDEEEKKDDKGK